MEFLTRRSGEPSKRGTSPFKSSRTLWERQCVTCDGAAPSCNCAADEQCILTSRTCSQCPTIQCNKIAGSGGGGINPGVIAAPVVAVLVIASLGLFWWLRRKKRRDLARLEELAARAKKAEAAGFHLSQPGSPRSAGSQPPLSARSGRSRRSQLPLPPPSAAPRTKSPVSAGSYTDYVDENGNPFRVYHNDQPGDPFGDNQSISTSGSIGTGRSGEHIPIQYIAPSRSNGSLAPPPNDGVSAAAKALDEARQNLWKPKGAPTRPARAPGLDLRAPDNDRYDDRSPGFLSADHPNIRDSVLSGNSSAPSFLSGVTSSDIFQDAPKIVTSKQVQIGRLQQAEVVQWGANGKPIVETLGQGSKLSPMSQGDPSLSPSRSNRRSLTPTSSRHPDLDNEQPGSASTGDLRFSMGSLAYRDSVSTMGTGRYLAARPDSSAQIPLPRMPAAGSGARESMSSDKSFADSVLSGFPMIPPNASAPPIAGSGIPQSSSAATLHGQSVFSRPPPSFKAPPTTSPPRQRGAAGPVPAPSRPQTTASVADSFLGTFPFVPPNMDDLADLPSAALPTAAMPESAAGATPGGNRDGQQRVGRNTMGLSQYSEGLGGFDFEIESGHAPPVPSTNEATKY